MENPDVPDNPEELREKYVALWLAAKRLCDSVGPVTRLTSDGNTETLEVVDSQDYSMLLSVVDGIDEEELLDE